MLSMLCGSSFGNPFWFGVVAVDLEVLISNRFGGSWRDWCEYRGTGRPIFIC